MSQPENAATAGNPPATSENFRLTSPLPGQPRDAEGAVFAEPWQAQAFAMTVKLHEEGCFTWKEWTEALGAQIAEAERHAQAERGAQAEKGAPDDGSRYYEHWLAALETLITAKGLVDAGSLKRRRNDWEEAYRNTAHGQPVHLKE